VIAVHLWVHIAHLRVHIVHLEVHIAHRHQPPPSSRLGRSRALGIEQSRSPLPVSSVAAWTAIAGDQFEASGSFGEL
jgi:hypothetical protein